MKLDTILIISLVALIAVAFFIAQESKAERNFLDTVQIIIGVKESHEGARPEDTLVAPFAEDNVKPASKEDIRNKRVGLPINKIPLNQPHRSIEDVETWLSDAIADSLTLDKGKVDGLNQKIKPYFTEEGFKHYSEFGKNTKIFSLVYYDPKASLVSFIGERPLNVHAQPVKGIYQWRFQINVMLNMTQGPKEGAKQEATPQKQRELTLCIDVIRTNSQQGEGLAINAWGAVACPTEKGRMPLFN